ncbi:hypothetical protein B0H34DRAFT_784636 [Crassisporium funariophilum]|nr:hypothetical protein B0H34DRAFT_784636 [Crassisporium funariophilum]
MMMKKCEVQQAVLFALGWGALPVHSLHLYCESTNCAQIFNMCMTDNTPAWQFSLSVTSDEVYTGFTVVLLLEDCIRQKKTLVVLHGGKVFHHCTKCTQVYNLSGKVSVIVIDGVSVDHACCGVPNCKIPLENNRHRFCPEHSCLNSICSIVSCSNAVIPGRKSCALVDYQHIENVYNLRTQTVCSQFGRRRTHNEQLFVAPCGMIVARETFYHAEALYSVIEMIKQTYHLPGTMPEHIFFDNNCSIAKIVKNNLVFKNVGLTVDVYHFNCKHSVQDQSCWENCNPAAYPKLLGENGKAWYFNLSVAEQTNAWLGGYKSICCKMTAHHFNFFLDKMIYHRNIITKKKLEKEGCKQI